MKKTLWRRQALIRQEQGNYERIQAIPLETWYVVLCIKMVQESVFPAPFSIVFPASTDPA